MVHLIPNVLSPTDMTAIRDAIREEDYTDGKATAGPAARDVKHNLQVTMSTASPVLQSINSRILKALQQTAEFQYAIHPKVVHGLRVARYDEGMGYGPHVDDPYMANSRARTDVSVTIALGDASEYDGGELVIGAPYNQTVRLPAGSLVAYPSTTLHEVKPITRGSRLVVVCWIESQIRDAARRELLYDISKVRLGILAKDGKTPEFDLLTKSYGNLVRMWAD